MVTTVAFAHRGRDWITGMERCLLDLIAGLDRTKFRPLVICEQPSMVQAATELGAEVYQLPPANDWGVQVPAALTATRRKIFRILRDNDVRLVHSNASAIVPALLPAVRRLRIPLVTHIHLPLTDQYYRIHELVHQSDVTVGVAEHILTPLRRDGVSEGRLRVILNAVDGVRLARGDATMLRQSLGIPIQAIVLCSLGSLVSRKAHDISIRALAVVLAKRQDVHLLICGTGEEEKSLQLLSGSLGVQDNVHLLGFQPHVGAILRDAVDICVTSAREEAMPLNVLEAQWLGIPVIASDIEAHHEALVSLESSRIVSLDNPAALASAILELSDNRELRAAAKLEPQRIAHQRFQMQRYVNEFSSLYSDLLARPKSMFGWIRGASWPPIYTRKVVGVLKRRLHLPS